MDEDEKKQSSSTDGTKSRASKSQRDCNRFEERLQFMCFKQERNKRRKMQQQRKEKKSKTQYREHIRANEVGD